jgi:hypothetical protein
MATKKQAYIIQVSVEGEFTDLELRSQIKSSKGTYRPQCFTDGDQSGWGKQNLVELTCRACGAGQQEYLSDKNLCIKHHHFIAGTT